MKPYDLVTLQQRFVGAEELLEALRIAKAAKDAAARQYDLLRQMLIQACDGHAFEDCGIRLRATKSSRNPQWKKIAQAMVEQFGFSGWEEALDGAGLDPNDFVSHRKAGHQLRVEPSVDDSAEAALGPTYL
ncbi:hypothetical protein [Candidatus Poriferisodalis sp.]|uniref:hypothetical protein n=1 Tax=Candidatus Poriferisodalis sp. TaxID=3101277 RepID=UPI003B022B97